MKKIGLLLVSLVGYSTVFYAQQHHWCGTDAHLHKTFTENPALEASFVEHNARIATGQVIAADRTDPIIIPVVVHVLHDNGIGNISYEQIQSGIDQLNEDYNRLNPDSINTRNDVNAPFEPIAANIGIEFRLARIDPDGNCTNGVERRNAPGMTYNANDDAKHTNLGGLDAWDRNKYMNVWVVNSIESDGIGGITLGYAAFPQFANDEYGLLIRHDALGTIGTGSGDRTLTHEIGHCLGLLHTFQGPFIGAGTGCHTSDCETSGDFCCDTPPATAAHWDCPVTYNSCTSTPTNDFYGFDAYDQWENYMSYAPCQNMFSEGQKAIILYNLSDITFLVNLVSLSNQAATGVLDPEALCQAAFYTDVQTICAGGSVSFFDESFFNPTGWNWTFEGGTTPSNLDQNPVVTYATAGTYDVTLEVSDGVSTVSVTLPDYIVVLPDPGDLIPYKEGFEQLSTLPDNDRFFVTNDNAETTWELNSTVAYSGNDCAYIANFGINDGSKDELISGTIDLSGVSAGDPMIFYFRYAYQRRTSADDEWLRFYISKDCGETWTLRKNLHGSTLSPDVNPAAFVPTSEDDWTEVQITNITSDFYVSDFRYRFEFENDNGNNIYLDHINMYPESMTGLADVESVSGLSVFPNPAANEVTITLIAEGQLTYDIRIYDAVGNEVAVIYSGTLSNGYNTLSHDLSNLADGVYVIKVANEEFTETIKLIKD
jgi:PKD repeat protein